MFNSASTGKYSHSTPKQERQALYESLSSWVLTCELLLLNGLFHFPFSAPPTLIPIAFIPIRAIRLNLVLSGIQNMGHHDLEVFMVAVITIVDLQFSIGAIDP